MLDKLNPAARSLVVLCVIAPIVALVLGFVAAVLTAGGVSGVEWAETAKTALDTAGVALATGVGTFITMWVTPLTRRYGPGSVPGEVVE
jgi:uncharacterized membrane protein